MQCIYIVIKTVKRVKYLESLIWREPSKRIKRQLHIAFWMVRFRKIRNRLREVAESTFTERLLLILPFFIMSLDLYLFIHALSLRDVYVIVPVLILLAFSIMEILVTLEEVHERAMEHKKYRDLEAKVRKAIGRAANNVTVRSLMNHILEEHPELRDHEKALYHVICQILAENKE